MGKILQMLFPYSYWFMKTTGETLYSEEEKQKIIQEFELQSLGLSIILDPLNVSKLSGFELLKNSVRELRDFVKELQS